MYERIKYESCPLCEGDFEHFLTDHEVHRNSRWTPQVPKEMTWVRCLECGHIFTEGYWDEETLGKIIQLTVPEQQLGYEVEVGRLLSAKIVEKALDLTGGVWLDVGFGNGNLLFTAKEYGFHPVGLDLREENVDEIREIGIEAYCDYLETFNPDYQCSVISMCDVLEHIPYPKNTLKAAHKLLKDDGLLIISMPNIESIIWMAMKDNPYNREVEHFHNFGRKRLYKLLFECGFTPKRYGISERYISCMEVVASKST